MGLSIQNNLDVQSSVGLLGGGTNNDNLYYQRLLEKFDTADIISTILEIALLDQYSEGIILKVTLQLLW